ncbi:hypothetical protein HN954_03535 [bacterium]|jgi:hypothetical protein|nr:hypothetical protein [bacterium]MBT6996475.1 hypothetical protein [bacterium]MBT7772507.1 hypothetical protein [bacterium]
MCEKNLKTTILKESENSLDACTDSTAAFFVQRAAEIKKFVKDFFQKVF